MKTRLLIALDLLVGLPLCTLAFLLSLPLRLLGPAGGRASRRGTGPDEVRTILVIKLLGLGSVLLATPMLRKLRRSYPDAHIAFLTFDSNAELVRRLESVDEVVVVQRRSVGRLLCSLPGVFWALRRRRFDLVIDLEFYSRLSSVLSWAIGARRRIGFFVRARWRGSLLTDDVYFNARLPFGQAVMALLHPLGLERDDPQLLLVPPESLSVPSVGTDEAEEAWQRLINLGLPAAGRYVVVNVNASDLCVERRWPGERFAGLVGRFEREIASADRFVFIGSGAETEVVARVLSGVDPGVRERCLDVSGRTSLVDLAVLLSRGELLITNDSGPLHLAAALGVPTVSFFGPETPTLYGPVGAHHLVFYSGHWCSPCLSVYNAKIAMCDGENECMRRLGLDEVVLRTAAFCREHVDLPAPRPADRPFLPAGFDLSGSPQLTDGSRHDGAAP